jgi:hypothetical protein
LTSGESALKKHLDAVADAHGRLRAVAEKGFTYRHVPPALVNQPLDKLVAVGVYKENADGTVFKTVKGKINLPDAWSRNFIYDQGSGYRMFNQFVASNRIAVVKLLDAFNRDLQAGDLLVPLICARSLLEQISHCNETLAFVREQPEPRDRAPAWEVVGNVHEWLGKKTYGTRMDWMAFLSAAPGEIPKKKSVAYQREVNRIDRTAETILNAVDHLDKKVAGTRVIYEMLCEFAHPNVGSFFVAGVSCRMLPRDTTDVVWIEKHLGLEPPIEFLRSFGVIIEKILKNLSQCLVHYEGLLHESNALSDKLLRMTQTIMRHAIAHRKELFNAYDICPCGSTKKIKFCCGK